MSGNDFSQTWNAIACGKPFASKESGGRLFYGTLSINRDEPNFSAAVGRRVYKTIEKYTASIPSSAYLAIAVGAMGFSLLCQVAGKGKWGNFIAQWVPTWLIIGLYNKTVKQEGDDQFDRG